MESIRLGKLKKASKAWQKRAALPPEPASIPQTELHDTSSETTFLRFIHILSKLRIPTAISSILDPSARVAASGTLGKGAQYVVDRVHENQRFVGASLTRREHKRR